MPQVSPDLSAELRRDIDRAGYYPEVVADVLDVAIAGESVAAHFVYVETTFDADVRRHLSVFVLTATRFITAHADDHDSDGPDGPPHPYATVSSESVPLSGIRSVVVSHVIPRPDRYRSETGVRDLTLTVGWGAVHRVDLQPAGCADPDCTSDHGYTGTMTAEDVAVRVSTDADGPHVVRAALSFARSLSAATALSAS
ncbi:MAG: DUF5998 family protein [Actinomycetota bacterium]